jgi:hypothetical protein
MHTRILTERLDVSASRLDPDNRIIFGVTLIRAGMSKNRRFYSEDVLRAAAPVFQNAKAYVNHLASVSGIPASHDRAIDSTRSLRDLSGWYGDVKFHNGALVADRYFTRTAAGDDSWAVAQDIVAGRAPATLAGLSINAVGQGDTQSFPDGEAFNVECITHAISVDDVSEPAAGGAYIGESGDDLAAHLLAALSYDEWTRARPDFFRRLQAELKAVRQDEAVRAARLDADSAAQALADLREAYTRLQADHDSARADADGARRALDAERLLAQARVPAAWLDALRGQLAALPADEWLLAACSLIAAEESKARAAGFRTGVAVSGADPQTFTPKPNGALVTAPLPPLDMNRLRTPEDLAALLRTSQS